MNRQLKQHRLFAITAFWVVILVTVGAGQRLLRSAMETSAATPVGLNRPLASLPFRVGPWQGMDVPLDARIAERAANDDFINRRYVDLAGNRFIDLFVAYTATPANMLGHRPEVCYAANGWRLEQVRTETLHRPDGTSLGVLIHRFSRGNDQTEGLVVLNYYVLRGEHTTDADQFSGAGWRGPNVRRDPGFYVAQVQVVHPVYFATLFERGESTVRQFAVDVADHIDTLLPGTRHAAHANRGASGP
jgi:hypothetical protein